MKIHLTSEEYRQLLDLLYIADWVMHAHEVDDSDECADHDLLIQKLYSYAAEAGCPDLVTLDPKHRDYQVSAQFEEETPAHEFIARYDDDTFWDELTERLTERDLEEEQGGQTTTLSVEEYFRLAAPIREMYEEEFGDQGVARLRIVET